MKSHTMLATGTHANETSTACLTLSGANTWLASATKVKSEPGARVCASPIFENLLPTAGAGGQGKGRIKVSSTLTPRGQMVCGGASLLSIPKIQFRGPRAPKRAAMCIWFGNNARGLKFLGLEFGVSPWIFLVAPDLSRFLLPLPPRLLIPRDSKDCRTVRTAARSTGRDEQGKIKTSRRRILSHSE